ncbi:MAG: YIP1 family protein [Gemmatimonadaceae bacterium]
MTITKRSIIDRMRGAAMLDIATYEEVEADASATGQAAIVVTIAAVCSAIGAIGHEEFDPFGTLVTTLIGWLVWSGVTYVIGDKLFGGTATWGELLRTLGFAKSPYLLLVLGIIPVFGYLVWVTVAVWVLIAGIVAIRQALDFSTQKALLTALVAWVIEYTVFWLLGVEGMTPGF